jgi:uncharacterized protein YndB with AHSA1/START domain
MKHLSVRRTIHAPNDVVWDALIDHEGMVDWSPMRRVTLLVEGSPERNGVGAVRRMAGPGMTLEEEVVDWNPPHWYEYRLTRGAPIRHHHGRVALEDRGADTHVRWAVTFAPALPGTGWLIAGALERGLGGMLTRLARRLER